jgi:hypothetical protein
VADQILPLNAGSGGLNLDVEELTVGANTVERQRGQIAGSGAAEVARVINAAPAGTEYGLVTRPVVSDVTATGTLNALNAAGTITTSGLNAVGMQLASGTFKGTLVAEISMDGGTTWAGSYFVDPATSNVTTSFVTSATNNPATTRSIILPGGASMARVRVSAFTSGTASVTLRADTSTQTLFPFATSPGATAPPVVAALGGVDISVSPNLTRALQCATDGSLFVSGTVTEAGSVGANGVPMFAKDTSNNARFLRVDTAGQPDPRQPDRHQLEPDRLGFDWRLARQGEQEQGWHARLDGNHGRADHRHVHGHVRQDVLPALLRRPGKTDHVGEHGHVLRHRLARYRWRHHVDVKT